MRKNTSNLKKKQKQSLQIGEKTIKEDVNKTRRNMDGQVTRDGKDSNGLKLTNLRDLS